MDTTPLNGHKRAVIYCRVSSKGQKEDGTSLSKQMEACHKYAIDNGFEIVGKRYYDLKHKIAVSEPSADTFPVSVYADDFTGTVPIEERPEGRQVYAMLINGDADALIVFCVDRLMRPKNDGDEVEIASLVRGLAGIRCEIHDVEQGKIGTTFLDLIMAQLKAYAAGNERRKILDRMADGKRRKVTDLKKWVGTSRPPYGYTKIGKKKETYLEINRQEARIVRRMFDLYLGLNGETAIGMGGIAALFNAEGIPVTGRLQDEKKPMADRVWRPSTINHIMGNRAYIGEFEWGGEVVTIPTLAIIPREVFDAARAQREVNRAECKRNVKFDYLLQGRISCTCGRKMSANSLRNNYRTYLYYECNRKNFELSTDCDHKKIPADLVDRIAWGWLVDVFHNPEKLLAGLYEYQARQREKAEPQRARLVELPGLIAECEAHARRVSKSLERVPEDDELSAKTLEERLGQISAAHKHYIAERDRITAELAAVEVGEADIQQILEWAAEISRAIEDDKISFHAKRLIVERLKVTTKIEFQNGERGLRLDCPVLAYASKWQSLAKDCEQLLLNDCSQNMPQYTISGWVSLADEFFKTATQRVGVVLE